MRCSATVKTLLSISVMMLAQALKTAAFSTPAIARILSSRLNVCRSAAAKSAVSSGARSLVAMSSPRKSPRKNAVSVQGGAKVEAKPKATGHPQLLGSPARHIMVTDNFLPASLAASMRKTFDDRFKEPRTTLTERFVWDYWHVPEQYTLIRTPADHFFCEEDYTAFTDALTSYGQRELGCNSITQPWLSYYIDGCEQRMHTDSWHGPFAYVFSLTNWEARKFTGGETFIMNAPVLDYWRQMFDAKKGVEETTLLTHVPALMNRLTIFDPRLPHGVRAVRGTQDPREARLVVHGWFTDQGNPFYSGSIAEADATRVLNAALEPLYSELGEECARVMGVLNARIHVSGASGKVTRVESIADTLVPDPDELYDGVTPEQVRQETISCIHKHLTKMAFPCCADAQDSQITIPFVFE